MDNTGRSKAEVENMINTEEYLYTGAVIVAYNDHNLNGLAETEELVDRAAMMSKEEDIAAFAKRYFGSSATVISDLESRFQKIKLREKKAPDFFSTPEGESHTLDGDDHLRFDLVG